MHDYFLHEMAKMRIGELRAEAARGRAAREVRGSGGWRLHLGLLGGSGASRDEAVTLSWGTIEEACCA